MNFRNYLIEAWALGMFMFSAVLFAGLLELPCMPLHRLLPDPFVRRWLMGCAMGLTAVGLIYSGWGRRSGAHMNPAVTLAFLYLKKMDRRDAVFYVLAQVLGSAAAMGLAAVFFHDWTAAAEVDFVQTLPGKAGEGVAFLAETLISFGIFLTILYAGNFEKTARYTGWIAGGLVMLYITFEAPLSGMSMNPARSLASALAAGHFNGLWIYFLAPPLGMLSAAAAWKWWICTKAEFRCSLHG